MPTRSELFEANPDNACPAYKSLRDAKDDRRQAYRQHCEDLWSKYKPLADSHFLAEFPLHTHERWFEMYLAVSLKEAGYNVTKPKCNPNEGPDVLIQDGDRKIWIEAVCASPGELGKPDSVVEPPMGQVNEVSLHNPTLRFQSALKAKACKYNKYLENGIVGGDDILVVAINMYAIPDARVYMQDIILRGVYGYGDRIVKVSKRTREIIGVRGTEVPCTKKANNAEVDAQSFINGTKPHIAAILVNCSDLANRSDQLGSDFLLCPNLTPKTPWPQGYLKLGSEWLFNEDEEGWQRRKKSYTGN